MQPTSDEIRKVADKYDVTHVTPLYAIADRIDAEMVELPRDRDGVPIHVGDVMESNGANSLFGQASFEVRAMRYDEGGWEVYDRLGDRYMPSLLRHHHAPTVEDVLREFTDEVWNRCCEGATASDSGIDGLVAEYADKLRLAGKNA